MAKLLELNMKELDRVKVLSRLMDGELTQVLAAKMLGITDRQVRNLLYRFNKEGEVGCISKKRGKPSNRCLTNKREILRIVSANYPDFSPKLAAEYLYKNHNIKVSKETLRRWMTEIHLWIPREKGKKKIHPPRERRRTFGELIQIDGSHHDWFEGRGPPCVLMVCVDDATSTITSLFFSNTEDLEAYYSTLEKHLKRYGIPLGLYGDKCSTLCSRKPEAARENTQFQKALKELGCQLILASSPQAKGRVERANRTLQDRLVKLMRLKGVKSIEEANQVVEEYREEHNHLFSKRPVDQTNAHRPLEGISLEHVLSIRERRILDKNFTVQFRNTFYQISTQDPNVHLHNKASLEIRILRGGQMEGFIKGKKVMMKPLREIEAPIMDEKQIMEWPTKKVYHPPQDHPYKQALWRRNLHEGMKRYVV